MLHSISKEKLKDTMIESDGWTDADVAPIHQVGTVQPPFAKCVFKRQSLFVLAFLCLSIQSAVAAPVEVDLTGFRSGTGVRFHGASPGTLVGYSVSVIGDHNGDGFQDYIYSSASLATAVIVMKRNSTYSPLTISATVSGQYFRVLKGPTTQFGHTLGGIGDINADGFDDVIVGSLFGEVAGRGAVGYSHVFFGMAGPFADLTVTATWAASSLGFMILGTQVSNSFIATPRTAHGLGDINGDGIVDFAVATKYFPDLPADNTAAGVVYVIYGKKDSAFATIDLLSANFGSNGIYYVGANNMALGYNVMPAGDFNGDGIADFLLSAHEFDPVVGGAKRNDAGAAYLIHGSKTALTTLHMSNFTTGSLGVRFLGGASNDKFGVSLAGVGDINDDGLDDIAFGAYAAAAPVTPARMATGIVYVIYGTTVAFTVDLDLKAFSSFSQGFVIFGATPGAQIATVAPAGDINGDGVSDVVVGSVFPNGKVSIVYGMKTARSSHVDLLTASATTFSFTNGAFLGFALDGGSDLNGDGIPDVILGGFLAPVTPESGGSQINPAGAVWMLPGPFVVPSDAPTIDPSAMPSRIPSMVPSADPSIQPSETPTFTVTASPSEVPSFAPTMYPSTDPSMEPTAEPTKMPSASPSEQPSLMPSADPSVNPTLTPSTAPSLMPTVVPSAVPTFVPSMAPSAIPTIRPTKTDDVDFELIVSVEQDVFNLSKDDYDAQQPACNLTIQHTVADGVIGVTPERVTDIVVEEEEEEGDRSSFRTGVSVKAGAGAPLQLMYTLTVRDPLYTVAILRTELVQAAQEGTMDERLRFYAAQFGATAFSNVTFGTPRVTGPAESNDSTKGLEGWHIALIVIGGVLALVLIVGRVWWKRSKTAHTTVLPVVQDNRED